MARRTVLRAARASRSRSFAQRYGCRACGRAGRRAVEQLGLIRRRLLGVQRRLGVEVPTLAALLHPQPLRPVRAGPALEA
jgi:hypothetical protein